MLALEAYLTFRPQGLGAGRAQGFLPLCSLRSFSEGPHPPPSGHQGPDPLGGQGQGKTPFPSPSTGESSLEKRRREAWGLAQGLPGAPAGLSLLRCVFCPSFADEQREDEKVGDGEPGLRSGNPPVILQCLALC